VSVPEPTASERRRAVLRVVLGTAQIAVALFAAVLLLQTGTSAATVVATVAAAFLVVLSRVVFRRT
jgi:hypothetical protein